MCFSAAALGTMALIGSVGQAVYGTISSVQQAKAHNNMMEYNARVAEQNARLAQAEADYARDQAWSNANEKKREAARLLGAQRAKMGASGAVVDSGTFLDLTLDTRERGVLDAFALLREGDNAAWRAEVTRDNYLQQANMNRASKVSTGGALAGSLLGGALGVGSTYFNLSQAGVFDTAVPAFVPSVSYDREMGLRDAGRLSYSL